VAGAGIAFALQEVIASIAGWENIQAHALKKPKPNQKERENNG